MTSIASQDKTEIQSAVSPIDNLNNNTLDTNNKTSNNNKKSSNDKPFKKSRTNYKKPENAAKLNAAVNALVLNRHDPFAQQDIRTVSKLYDIPYNTLRDNYLK
jgi:hypothetical protein